ncbi:ATP-binding protein [Streptomyces globosus]|uniref:ATP-binding protein n=1 Tax=Streptomyces globosus TaxID=68209 RepID=UPI0036419DEB
MRYAILGSVQVVRGDGTPVAVGGARLRALLTALALRAGRPVPVHLLTADVWAGEPPADGPAALQALVGRLRRALGREAVRSAEGGYLLAAARDDVDAYRFERLVRAAAETVEGDPARAAALYDEALALWRGPALADLPEPGAEAARWEAVRADARRGRLAAALGLGEAERVLPELAELCGRHPLDEPLQGLRIRALRDAGRAAEALAAFEEVRRELADRLGTDPGPALRALHAGLLAPLPGAAGAAGPAAVGEARPGNLKARLTTFVGREEDIRAIGADLGRARLVTLLGPGGAGKTRLSQEAAEAHAAGAAGGSRWPDGVWFAELAPVTDPDDVAEAVLTALGARETKLRGASAEELRALTDRAGDEPLARLTEHCARRGMLLVLDNCEHVVGAAAELAERLLTHCPGVRILATSREPLGVPGEFLRPVEPLPDHAALRLLDDRGAAARPGFTVAEDPDAAAEICRRLDGLPLAIELAAARLRMLTPRQIADRLDDRFRLLTGGARTVLPRQQTLRAVVDWSWELLDAAERRVLARLSVFAGGCDLPAAEAVCADPDPDPEPGPGPGPDPGAGGRDGAVVRTGDVASVVGSLVDKSLVIAAPGPRGMRYRMLETVAEYAGERLAAEAGEAGAAERRHLVHYREFARAVEPLLRGAGQREAGERLAADYDNLRSALRRAVAARDAGEALCLVHCLVWYWQMHDLRAECRHWANAVAELGPDPFRAPVAPAGPVHERIADTPPPYHGEALTEAWRGIRLLQLAARDQNSENWNSPEVRPLIDGILAAYRPGLPQTCRAPGSLWIYAVMIGGDAEMLRRTIDATVETARAFDYRWELAGALQLRANVLANRAAWAGDASRDAEESLALFTALGDDWGCAEALSARAEAREKHGLYALAADDFRAAIRYAERLGAPSQVTVLRVRMAGVLMESGRHAEAEELLADVLRGMPRSYGNEAMPAAHLFMAVCLGRRGRIADARAHIRQLREEFAMGAYAVFDCYLLATTAWLDNQDGRHEQALEVLRQALESARDPLADMVAPQLPAVYMLTAARARAGLGGREEAVLAARLLGAYRALLPDGHVPVATEREDLDRTEELVRGALDDAAYGAAYAEGGGLTLEEAAALI